MPGFDRGCVKTQRGDWTAEYSSVVAFCRAGLFRFNGSLGRTQQIIAPNRYAGAFLHSLDPLRTFKCSHGRPIRENALTKSCLLHASQVLRGKGCYAEFGRDAMMSMGLVKAAQVAQTEIASEVMLINERWRQKNRPPVDKR